MTTPAPPAPASPGSRLPAVILALLINAVPIVGVLRYGWSGTNVLVLYWFENLLIAICTTIRLVVHRELTRKRGYYRVDQIGVRVNDKPVKAGFVAEYAIGAFAFTLAHGVFVGVIVLILRQNYSDNAMWHLTLAQVVPGVLVVTAMVVIELLADLFSIRSKSFAAMKQYAQARMGRVVILHLAIIFGMFAMAMMDSPFGVLYVLIGLKTLTDVAGAMSGGATVSDEPVPPPAWSLKMADKLGKDKGGSAGFMKKWRQDAERERRNVIEDEEPLPARQRH